MSADINAIKRELDKYLRDHLPAIELIRADSATRRIAELIEAKVPGMGVEIAVDICKEIGSSTVYLQDHETITKLGRDEWIRSCGYSDRVLYQVTGLGKKQISRIQEGLVEQIRLPGM